jgi:hypothetical protein
MPTQEGKEFAQNILHGRNLFLAKEFEVFTQVQSREFRELALGRGGQLAEFSGFGLRR